MTWTMGAAITREQAQDLALSEAQKGAGFVSPNPLVGCVVVDEQHRFLASGYHAQWGGPHAEVDALNKLSSLQLKNATVYVTLEPCSHHGKTPPCAERLLKEPIKSVVVGLMDPNPLVAGRGIQLLKDKGIQVEVDPVFGQRCQKLAEIFLWHIQNKIPFVALKIATSMDGRVALKNGQSQWITSEASRKFARQLRGRYDATLIGAGTLLQDNPRLDFRDTAFAGRKTNRVVIWDPQHQAEAFLPGSELQKTLGRDNIILLHDAKITHHSLEKLYEQKIYSLYVEGGGYTLSQFIEGKFFNKIYQFVAPCLMGDGLGWTESLKLQQMSERVLLEDFQVQPLQQDILLTAYLKH